MSADFSATDTMWVNRRNLIEKCLSERLSAVKQGYDRDLTDNQFKRLQNEEFFIGTVAEFLNDSETYINILKNKVNELADMFGIECRGHDEDRKIFSDALQDVTATERARAFLALADLVKQGKNRREIFDELVKR